MVGDAKPRIGLALGSGAIRGLAHIGVLKYFDSIGIAPDYIVGSSAGALVGCLYSVGTDLALLESFAASLKWRQLADFCMDGRGLIKGERVHALLRILTRNQTFAGCRCDFTAVATDLCTGERVLMREGCLADAVRASISIPGIFCPFEWSGRTLIDGGIVGRVPVSAVRELGADLVIGVDVNMGLNTARRPANIFEVILQSIDIMEEEVLRSSMGEADLVITPSVGSVGPLDLSKARDIVAAGHAAAEKSLPQLMSLIGG